MDYNLKDTVGKGMDSSIVPELFSVRVCVCMCVCVKHSIIIVGKL